MVLSLCEHPWWQLWQIFKPCVDRTTPHLLLDPFPSTTLPSLLSLRTRELSDACSQRKTIDIESRLHPMAIHCQRVTEIISTS